MVTVTEQAKNKIVELRQKDGLNDNYAIRVAVQGGGCSGLMYDLQFDTAQQPTDQWLKIKGFVFTLTAKACCTWPAPNSIFRMG